MYVSVNWVSIGSDNGLSPDRLQAIIWTNAGILLIGPLGTNFREIWFNIQNFSFMKIYLKISSGKWRPFCRGGDELTRSVFQLSSSTSGPSMRMIHVSPLCLQDLPNKLVAYKHNPAWISNYMPSKVWCEITYPLTNFICCIVEAWEWINNFTPTLWWIWTFIHARIKAKSC